MKSSAHAITSGASLCLLIQQYLCITCFFPSPHPIQVATGSATASDRGCDPHPVPRELEPPGGCDCSMDPSFPRPFTGSPTSTSLHRSAWSLLGTTSASVFALKFPELQYNSTSVDCIPSAGAPCLYNDQTALSPTHPEHQCDPRSPKSQNWSADCHLAPSDNSTDAHFPWISPKVPNNSELTPVQSGG